MMTPSNQQQQPFLPTSKSFPTEDPVDLRNELSKMYIDIAQSVNRRIIGTFDTFQVLTGELWYATSTTNASLKRQTYRKVFTFGAIAAGANLAFNHNIQSLVQFTRTFGEVITNVPDYRSIPYASVTLNANIEVNKTSTQIIIYNGASSPNIVSGIITLEYTLN